MSVFLRTSLHPDSVANGGLYLGALFFGLINVMFGVLRLPISIYESLLWTVITYYTIGFAPEATRYEIQNPIGGWVYVNQVECLSPHYV
jgi:hypothetical protein